jgi:hypothetical protein
VAAVVTIALKMYPSALGPDITRRAIRHALRDPNLLALYRRIVDKRFAHQECGRRIRSALGSNAGARVWLTRSSIDVIGSYAELAVPDYL